MKAEHEPTFVKVLETDSITDLALIKSTLDPEGIRYLIQGENMRFIGPYGAAILMVADEDVDRAASLLKPLQLTYTWINFW